MRWEIWIDVHYLELFWLGFIQKILTYYTADFERKNKQTNCCFSTNLDVIWNMKSISRKRTKWHAVLEAHYTDVRYGKSVRYNHSACYVSWDSLWPYVVLCTIQSQVCPVTTSRSGNSQCKRQQRNTSIQRSTKANGRVLVSLITGALGVLKIWSV